MPEDYTTDKYRITQGTFNSLYKQSIFKGDFTKDYIVVYPWTPSVIPKGGLDNIYALIQSEKDYPYSDGKKIISYTEYGIDLPFLKPIDLDFNAFKEKLGYSGDLDMTGILNDELIKLGISSQVCPQMYATSGVTNWTESGEGKSYSASAKILKDYVISEAEYQPELKKGVVASEFSARVVRVVTSAQDYIHLNYGYTASYGDVEVKNWKANSGVIHSFITGGGKLVCRFTASFDVDSASGKIINGSFSTSRIDYFTNFTYENNYKFRPTYVLTAKYISNSGFRISDRAYGSDANGINALICEIFFVERGGKKVSNVYEPGGWSGTHRDDGDYDLTSCIVPHPSTYPSFVVGTQNGNQRMPTHIYVLENNNVIDLFNYLWGNDFNTLMEGIFIGAADSILSFKALPLSDIYIPPASPLIVGQRETSINLPWASQPFTIVQWDSLRVPAYWGNFADYDPYTKIQLYLPYIGYVSLSADEVIEKVLSLRYVVDFNTGAFIATVQASTGDESFSAVIGQYTGSMAYEFPLNSANYRSTVESLVSILTSGAQLIANPTAQSAINTVADTAYNVMSAKPDYKHSGNIGSNIGWYGVQRPYLLIHRPRQSIPSSFGSTFGYPSNLTSVLSSLSGFTKIREIHLEGIPATEAEIDEIEGLLKEGIII